MRAMDDPSFFVENLQFVIEVLLCNCFLRHATNACHSRSVLAEIVNAFASTKEFIDSRFVLDWNLAAIVTEHVENIGQVVADSKQDVRDRLSQLNVSEMTRAQFVRLSINETHACLTL